MTYLIPLLKRYNQCIIEKANEILKSVSTSDEISEPNSLMQKMILKLHEQTLTLYCMRKVNIESKTNYFSRSKVIA
jgi:hypothetical protein